MSNPQRDPLPSLGEQENPENALNILRVELLQLSQQGGWAWRIAPFVHAVKHRKEELESLCKKVLDVTHKVAADHTGAIIEVDVKKACQELFQTGEKKKILLENNEWGETIELLQLDFQKSFQKEATEAVKRLYEEGVGDCTKLEKPRNAGDPPGLTLFVVSQRLVTVGKGGLVQGESAAERACGPVDKPSGYESFDKEIDQWKRENEEGPHARLPQPNTRYADWICNNPPFVDDPAIFVTWNKADAYVKSLYAGKQGVHLEHIRPEDMEGREKKVPFEITLYEVKDPKDNNQIRLVTIHKIHFNKDDRVDIKWI
jgi:hypothetical protein